MIMGKEDLSFRHLSGEILQELTGCIQSIDETSVDNVVQSLCEAEKVFAVGVGRVLLMLQAFVKRLNHLGIEAYYVGEVNEPAITAKDVLVVASGSGESEVPVSIAKVAKKYHPKIVYIGSNLSSTAASMSDLQLRIPCRTKLNLPDELSSVQPMSSMFEQSLLLCCDTLAYRIVMEKQLNMKELWRKHANLE